MRRAAAIGPPRLGVRRYFEPTRLAKDCQARAYELVPVGRRSKTTMGTKDASAAGVDRDGVELLSQGGVAA